MLAILFVIVVFALGRRRGLMALASMAVTVFVLVVFIEGISSSAQCTLQG